MNYLRPTYWDELLHCFHTLIYLFWRKTTVKLDDSCVILVMDVINGYSSLYSKNVMNEINKTIKMGRANKSKIIFTRWVRHFPDNIEDCDEIDKKGHWSFYVPRSGTDLMIEPAEGDIVIDVRHTNAFVHAEFAEQIGKDKTIVFTGAWAESCIINTVRHAVDKNMKTIVIKDACAGHSGAFQYSMYVMHSIYTTVFSTVG